MAKRTVSEAKFYEEVGRRIREVREAKGISITALEAMENSFDKSNISKIETGQQWPELFTVYRIAALLDVDVSVLLPKQK